MSEIEVYQKRPDTFFSHLAVVGCYVEVDSQLLILQRADNDLDHPGCWTVPSGTVEREETLHVAAQRELFEETGIILNALSKLQYIGELFIQTSKEQFVFHLFGSRLSCMPKVRLSAEHQDFKWATMKELEKINLMAGAQETLQYYKRIRTNVKHRTL